MALSGITLKPSPDVTPAMLVVILHGWGSNAEDIAGLVPALELTKNCWVSAPNGPLDHPYAPTGRMWYDLEDPQWPGLTDSKTQLNEHLDQLTQSSGIPLSRTILMGFSQGGAMALEVGLSLPVAGIAVFSGYLHPHLAERPITEQFNAPLLLIHGRQDPVVPFQAAEQIHQYLQSSQTTCNFHALNMGHEITADALMLAKSWADQTINHHSPSNP